jgi:hypothetical protein
MAKNSKQSKELPAQESNPAAANIEPRNGSGTIRQPVAKKAASSTAGRPKTAAKNGGGAARKSITGPKPRTKATQQSPVGGGVVVTDEEIRMRAYFISELRRQNAIAGDSANDWLDAKRQLQEEAGKRN